MSFLTGFFTDDSSFVTPELRLYWIVGWTVGWEGEPPCEPSRVGRTIADVLSSNMKLSVELPPDQAAKLQQEAARLGVSLEDLAKAVLTDLLNILPKKASSGRCRRFYGKTKSSIGESVDAAPVAFGGADAAFGSHRPDGGVRPASGIWRRLDPQSPSRACNSAVTICIPR